MDKALTISKPSLTVAVLCGGGLNGAGNIMELLRTNGLVLRSSGGVWDEVRLVVGGDYWIRKDWNTRATRPNKDLH